MQPDRPTNDTYRDLFMLFIRRVYLYGSDWVPWSDLYLWFEAGNMSKTCRKAILDAFDHVLQANDATGQYVLHYVTESPHRATFVCLDQGTKIAAKSILQPVNENFAFL